MFLHREYNKYTHHGHICFMMLRLKRWYSRNAASVILSLPYKNQSIDLRNRSMDWFLYDRDLRHERVKGILRPILYNNKNTNIDRKWKIMQSLLKKNYFFKMFKFLLTIFIDIITPVILFTHIACEVMCVQHVIQWFLHSLQKMFFFFFYNEFFL